MLLILAAVVVAMMAAFAVGALIRSSTIPAEPEPPSVAELAGPAEPTPAPSRPEPEPERPLRRRPAPRSEPPPGPAPAPTGTLLIDSDVPGASVFIDRVFVGTTPVTAIDVSPGSHRLNVSVQGYEGYADTIDVVPGEREIMVRFKEVRLDVSLDVVHKHRFGSCTGRLVANPKALRYETDDEDDVFSTPLLALDAFEIDYLDKNLKIKPRGGKTYNFTDPEGNADRLFVFHREVEKARTRLANQQ